MNLNRSWKNRAAVVAAGTILTALAMPVASATAAQAPCPASEIEMGDECVPQLAWSHGRHEDGGLLGGGLL
ncbi:hypothetical protein [Streptomyces boninensis]|uniref:hypothetical protein n=1 Tax=Streptomyces boninensis TaxID=2039455 RepID=UPI003B21B5C1